MRVEAREQAKYKEVMEGFMLDHWQNTKTVWEVRLGPAYPAAIFDKLDSIIS